MLQLPRRFVRPGRNLLATANVPLLVCLQGDLLSKHDISDYQPTERDETQAHPGPSGIVQFMYVWHHFAIDSISLSAIAADHIERSGAIELQSLGWRKPISHKP